MSDRTGIEWTDATWNPVVGCAYVSAGCENCYAAREAADRLAHLPTYAGLAVRRPGEPAQFTGEVRCLPERLDQPLRWRRPRRVFVNSMSDLFHPGVDWAFIAGVFARMALAHRHTFQVLTKRPQRMARMLDDPKFRVAVAEAATEIIATTGFAGRRQFDLSRWHPEPYADSNVWYPPWPLPNVWLGVSIETDRYAWRADHLRSTPAVVRFVSAEPLLGPLPSLDLSGIDWLIVGGESGPGARPMHPDWVRDLRDRTQLPELNDAWPGDRHTRFFFKQWGEWLPLEPDPQPPFWLSQHGKLVDSHHFPDFNLDPPGWDTDVTGADPVVWHRIGKTTAGRELDGRPWDEYPAVDDQAALL
jgi:protein gp37